MATGVVREETACESAAVTASVTAVGKETVLFCASVAVTASVRSAGVVAIRPIWASAAVADSVSTPPGFWVADWDSRTPPEPIPQGPVPQLPSPQAPPATSVILPDGTTCAV